MSRIRFAGRAPRLSITGLVTALLLTGTLPPIVIAQDTAPKVDWPMVARIREEGLQRSQLMDVVSYITDVLGARLTLSDDMARAQQWVAAHMRETGLDNVEIEPFMDYGVRWDNEYVSLHLMEPDYQPMVGYPLSHTPSTNGKQTSRVVNAEIRTRADLARLTGTLRGVSVLSTPPAVVDRNRFSTGVARYTDDQLKELEREMPPVLQAPGAQAPTAATPARPNPDVVRAAEQMAFYKAEGVVAVLQSASGWPGAVRGFARPGAGADGWARAETLASPPIVAITPEHYNRMYRLRQREVPVTIEIEIRNRVGEQVEQASNITGEIVGTDLKDEVVMIGAHLDTWHASPNASDNTSGVAVVLEAMRILKAVGATPRRTIRAALWAGEEQGLNGSREYVLKHFGDPASAAGVTPQYEKLSAYFNQDYGPGQYRGIYLQGNERARQMMTAWTSPFHDLGMTAVSVRGVGSTDHISFDRVGLPGFQFLQDRVGGTGGHTNLDFIETLPPDDLMKNAVIMASFAYHAAMSETRVPRKPTR
ncbi:MAG: M20/M25/M40 family metallo-hydrolase [Acidobacteria bacterium]|jgi:carboxypeptidase Q|nr:M20/M25/M40 family metallo-hydrolase [Acidobacteriota bacterium]